MWIAPLLNDPISLGIIAVGAAAFLAACLLQTPSNWQTLRVLGLAGVVGFLLLPTVDHLLDQGPAQLAIGLGAVAGVLAVVTLLLRVKNQGGRMHPITKACIVLSAAWGFAAPMLFNSQEAIERWVLGCGIIWSIGIGYRWIFRPLTGEKPHP